MAVCLRRRSRSVEVRRSTCPFPGRSFPKMAQLLSAPRPVPREDDAAPPHGSPPIDRGRSSRGSRTLAVDRARTTSGRRSPAGGRSGRRPRLRRTAAALASAPRAFHRTLRDEARKTVVGKNVESAKQRCERGRPSRRRTETRVWSTMEVRGRDSSVADHGGTEQRLDRGQPWRGRTETRAWSTIEARNRDSNVVVHGGTDHRLGRGRPSTHGTETRLRSTVGARSADMRAVDRRGRSGEVSRRGAGSAGARHLGPRIHRQRAGRDRTRARAERHGPRVYRRSPEQRRVPHPASRPGAESRASSMKFASRATFSTSHGATKHGLSAHPRARDREPPPTCGSEPSDRVPLRDPA